MKRHSFRNRLLWSFLVASLVPMIICSLLLFQISRMQMASRTQSDAQLQGQTLSQSLDRLVGGLHQAAQALQGDLALARAMSQPGQKDTQANTILFQATEGLRNLGSFQLYDLQGVQRYTTRGEATGQVLPLRWGILYAAQSAAGNPVFQAAQEQTSNQAPLLQGAVALMAGDAPMGYLVLDLTSADLAALLEGSYGAHNDILLLNAFWRPIYASQEQMFTLLAPELRQALLYNDFPQASSQDYAYTLVQNQATGLYLILRQPEMFSKTIMNMLYTASALCALIGIGISLVLSISLSRQIFRPIQRLQKAFSQLGQDDLNVQIKVSTQDELGQLAQEFNQMVAALNYNQQERIRNQQELNKAQVRMLQAQLNPHFLCNTLDTMKWISKINHLPQLALMSTNLADILRFCISAEEFVPLEREIQVLNPYIEIQKIRLSESFAFSVELPQKLADCLVPKMILQPLVENAILHGLEGIAGSWIQVRASQTSDGLLSISVTDNGQGLPPDMAGKPYRRETTTDGKHLGLYNVDTILKKHYGADYGLFLDTGPDGIGACITARLPIHRKEAQHAKSSNCGG